LIGIAGRLGRTGRGARTAALAVAVAVFAVVALIYVSDLDRPTYGSVVGVSGDVVDADYRVGSFVVSLEGTGEPSTTVLKVARWSDEGRVLWGSVPGLSFVSAGDGEEDIRQRGGHFTVEDEVRETRWDQTLDAVERRGEGLVVSGRLLDGTESEATPYSLTFSPLSSGRLRFEAEVEEPYDRVYLTYASRPEERFFGFGTQYTYFDLKGHEVPIFIQEQGIGRGAQPITLGADWQAGAGGDAYTSYASVPHYVTSDMRSLFLENYEYSAFDLRDAERVQVEVHSSRMTGQILSGDTPAELIEGYTEYSGRMRPLPPWILSGAVIGLQGGTETARETYEDLEALDTPVAALWLQDWVGRRDTSFGQQLWWNWELDRDRYPGWEGLVSDLRADDVRVMTYVNPFLVDASGKGNHRRNLFAEAAREGYLVEDRTGGPYMIETTDFSAALVDLTNPDARTWMKDVIGENLVDNGASGWMADFGEGLPYDAVLHSGESPRTYHNRYAEDWARLNREVVEDSESPEDLAFFTRSGYTRSPEHSTLFWLGDQLVSWDGHDGIKTAVTGMLSSGISGYSLQHSDIGGYTAISNPLKDYHRSRELQMRWTELAAFTTVFRTHEGNRPDDNHQFYSDEDTLRHFSRLAKVYAAWEPYREDLVREASETGLPVVRHTFIHYPRDPVVYGLREQFMVGSDLMVAPVLDPGEETVELYLPAGRWVHLWTGKEYGSPESGLHATVPAPMGEPAVFYREGSETGEDFAGELERQGLL
jgi:alpha-glucosidase